MTIIVVGCDHIMQPNDHPGDWRIESERRAFRDTIIDLFRRYRVEYIGEEAKWDCTTSTEDLARECGVKYTRVDIPKDIQQGVHYKKYEVDAIEQGQYWLAWELVREWHMYQEFLSQLTDVKSAMLVCGRFHVPAFIRLLTPRFSEGVVSVCLRLKHFSECFDCCSRSKGGCRIESLA
jgi:hypothetical protein